MYTTGMDLVGYARVSTDFHAERGSGLRVQERSIRAWCKANGHRLVDVCRDEGVSGSNGIEDRQGLPQALKTLRHGAASGLVVARLDRLARAISVQEAILAAIWQSGASVYAVDMGGLVPPDDVDDPMRVAMRQMAGVFAELDRRLVVKRLKDGREAKAAQGKHATGQYAYGYTGAGTGRDRDAAPDDDEQRTIARILELRSAGASYRQIVAALDAEGRRPRRAASWSPMAVRSVVLRAGL